MFMWTPSCIKSCKSKLGFFAYLLRFEMAIARFLGVISAVKTHRNSNRYDSLNQRWISEFNNPRQNLRERPQKLDNLWYFMCAICGLKQGGPGPYIWSRYIKKQVPVFCTCYKKFICWQQVKFFNFSGNWLLHESPFHYVNCLKLFAYLYCYLSTH